MGRLPNLTCRPIIIVGSTFISMLCVTFKDIHLSEIVCLHNQNPFNASRIDCLVDRKRIGIESVIVSNCSQSKKACTISLILCSRNRSVESVVIELGTS